MLNFICKAHRFFFGKIIFFKLNKLLYVLSLRGIGILNFESDEVSGEVDFIESHISKINKGVVFDVGANVGNYSKKIRESNSAVDIFCFEPHPVNFKYLKDKERDLNLNIFQCGVGSSDGILHLYDYADNDGSSHASLYKDVIEGVHKGNSVAHEVNIINLDEFSERRGIDKIALLKIDTEGHEFEVLKGFERYIRAGKVDLIHFEFNEMNIVSRVFFKDFWDFLPNYDFYRMMPNGLIPIKQYSPVFCEIFAYQNIVAKLKIIS